MSQSKRTPVFVTIICAAASLCAAPEVMWSVGSRDRSPAEFAITKDPKTYPAKFGQGFVYDTARNSASEWPFVHPGPEDDWAKNKQHKLAITFDLDAVPTGACELVLNAASVHANAPLLGIGINGSDALMRLTGSEQDAIYHFEKCNPVTFSLRFAPELLKQGRNEIALTTLKGSWLLYDEIHLQHDPSAKPTGVEIVSLQQNPCWIRTQGKPTQALTLNVFSGRASHEAQIVAECGGKTRRTSSRIVVGDNRIDVPLPSTDGSQANVTVTVRSRGDEVSTETAFVPQRQWKVFVVPSIHTDIGYTERQKAVFERHNENFDTALKMLRNNPDLKWNAEVAWELVNWLGARPKARQQELISYIKRGRFGVQAGYLNFLTALMSDEAMNRYAYCAANFQREFGIKCPTAVMTDIPTATWSLASTMAGSGIRYFAEGCNGDRGPMLPYSEIRAPFYWEGPDGAKVLTWLTESYAQSMWMSRSGTLSDLQRAVSDLVQRYDRADYPYDAIYVYGAFFDNCPIEQTYGKLLKEWNDTYAYPKLTVCDGREFFEYLENNFADKLETRRGDFGAYWEDGAGSTAQETIAHMENQRRLVAAETIWSLARMAGCEEKCPADRLAKAWDDALFYNEHTWGAAQSIHDPDCAMTCDQWTSKAEYARRPAVETEKLVSEAMNAYVSGAKARAESIVAVNPLSWKRSGLMTLPSGVGKDAVLVDDTGTRVPVQQCGETLVAWCKDVPGFGHKSLSVGSQLPGEDARAEGKLENKFYRIRLDDKRGITSIVDVESGKELVKQESPYKFGQIVYAAGGEETRIMQHSKQPEPKVVLNEGDDPLSPTKETVLLTVADVQEAKIAECGPVFSEAIIRSTAPSMPDVETRVRLWNNEKRISFDVQITSKTEIRRKEAVYVAFPFAMKSPAFKMGMTKCVADPQKDFVHGACHEWYCVQDFVSCRDGESQQEVVWSSPDAPLVTLSEINRGKWPKDAIAAEATVFSYTMNNYWHTNYKAGQGGDFRFRYELTSGRGLTSEQCIQFARGAAQPLLTARAGEAAATRKGIAVDGKGVVATLKLAENGKGTVVRIRNTENTAGEATIACKGWKSPRFQRTTLTEDPVERLADNGGECVVKLKPQETATVLVR